MARREFTPAQKAQIVARATDEHGTIRCERFAVRSKSSNFRWLEDVASNHRGETCIEWPFSIRDNGYGSIFWRGKRTTAHRVACELAHGAPPSQGLHAAHSCGNRKCCNPLHLRWASPSENHADKISQGTSTRGAAHYRTNLSEDDVKAIRSRAALGETLSSIASDFSLTFQGVSDITRRKNWRHI